MGAGAKKYLSGWLPLTFLALAALALFVGRSWFGGELEKEDDVLVEVVRDSFTVSIVERGLVRPARISPIKSDIFSNQAKIIWLIKEGATVTQGEVVARFDSKPFEDELSRAERDSGDAEATLFAAQKMLLVQQEEEQGRIEEAERKVEIARIEAENITNGSGPLERTQLEQRLSKAERAYRLAKGNLEDMEVLLKRGHASMRERDKAADEYETANEQLGVAKEELNNFDSYKWPKMVREAELLVNAAESELQRVKVTAELKVQDKSAQVEKARRNLANREAVRVKAALDLESCEVKAPTSGILLYSSLPRETGMRKIQIGDSIWVGQTFLEVPDTGELVVEVQIREIDVAKIREGMSAEVELDALPGKRFKGEVETVASLAGEGGKDNTIQRFYARIRLLEGSEAIHVGMSATVNIIYDAVQDCLVIPSSSVMNRDGRTVVRRQGGAGPELVEVELGLRGLDKIQVLSGLSEGDRVSSSVY